MIKRNAHSSGSDRLTMQTHKITNPNESIIQLTPNELLELTAYCARVLHAALPQNPRPMYGRTSTWC